MADALLYYVSGHGFGHAVRSAEVMRALLAMRPDVRLLVRSDAPGWLFPSMAQHGAVHVDVGLVQRDSLHHDVDASAQCILEYLRELPERVEQEAMLGRAHGVRVVIGDIPPLAFEVAARLGVPGLALGNFSWDGIYRGLEPRLPGLQAILDQYTRAYAKAAVLYRLPFHLPMPAFRQVEDVPLVARKATSSRAETRASLGLGEEPVVLLSFGGFDLEGLEIEELGHMDDYTFIMTPRDPLDVLPRNVRQLPRQQRNYTNLVAASDAVVTKPGYGIVSDCLAQRVPVLYTDRPGFPEYPVLAQALERWGHARFIPQRDLRNMWLRPHLDALLARSDPWPEIRLDGARVVAEHILRRLDGAGPRE